MQCVSCIPADSTALLSPCFLQEQGHKEQKTHLGGKHYHVFPVELGSAQQPSGKCIPWPCHSAGSLSCAGRATRRFQCTGLTIPQSPAELQVWKLEGTFNHSSCWFCSSGDSSQGGGAQSASPLLLQLHLRHTCPFLQPAEL